ncbi:hypothetical protein KI387_022145, partial [Taxus chinensis]
MMSRFLRRYFSRTACPIPTPWKCEEGVPRILGSEVFGELGKIPVEIGEEEITAARFAVDEYNKRQNDGLSYERVVEAERQIVAGYMYYLTMEVKKKEDEELKICKAQVWERPWLKQMQLEVFELKPLNAEAAAKVKP